MSHANRDLPRWHDIADAIFRRKFFILSSFLLLVAAVAGVWRYTGGKYESQMVLLVRNNRAEVMVTPGEAIGNFPQAGINEGQIATEAQLLMNRNSLRQVVQRCHLQADDAGSDPAALNKPVQALEREIRVLPMPKAGMIVVRYSHQDPKKAAEVLKELLAVYTEQHIRVHKAGSTAFFERQAGDHSARLREAQERLATFQRDSKIVLLSEQKELNLRRLMDMEAASRETLVALREGTERIGALREMVSNLAPRITTQVRNIPNQYLVERLQTMLADLGNKRIELLSKFRPDDRLVKQIEQQITDTQATLERAAKLSSTEQASDVNPLRQSLDADLARARMNQLVLKARAQTLSDQINEYRVEIAKLEQATASYFALVREVKSLEDKFQLYSRKWEESRIADALDQQKIANITVVEAPEAPGAKVTRSPLLPIGAVLLSWCLILCAAVLSGLHGEQLYTPQAIFQATGIQVLATVPEQKRWQQW